MGWLLSEVYLLYDQICTTAVWVKCVAWWNIIVNEWLQRQQNTEMSWRVLEMSQISLGFLYLTPTLHVLFISVYNTMLCIWYPWDVCLLAKFRAWHLWNGTCTDDPTRRLESASRWLRSSEAVSLPTRFEGTLGCPLCGGILGVICRRAQCRLACWALQKRMGWPRNIRGEPWRPVYPKNIMTANILRPGEPRWPMAESWGSQESHLGCGTVRQRAARTWTDPGQKSDCASSLWRSDETHSIPVKSWTKENQQKLSQAGPGLVGLGQLYKQILWLRRPKMKSRGGRNEKHWVHLSWIFMCFFCWQWYGLQTPAKYTGQPSPILRSDTDNYRLVEACPRVLLSSPPVRICWRLPLRFLFGPSLSQLLYLFIYLLTYRAQINKHGWRIKSCLISGMCLRMGNDMEMSLSGSGIEFTKRTLGIRTSVLVVEA